MQGSSRTPRSQASERVTVIVQRPVSPKDEAQQPPPPEVSTVPVDFAVPPSAFASLRGAGNSARSSVDLAPVSVSAGGNKGADEERADGRGDPAAEPQAELRPFHSASDTFSCCASCSLVCHQHGIGLEITLLHVECLLCLLEKLTSCRIGLFLWLTQLDSCAD